MVGFSNHQREYFAKEPVVGEEAVDADSEWGEEDTPDAAPAFATPDAAPAFATPAADAAALADAAFAFVTPTEFDDIDCGVDSCCCCCCCCCCVIV